MSVSSLLRCAIYTRKSSDEGLEQSFNSLHAQREACGTYIRSQQGEGWRALATKYDDGGYSGASLERPALRRLLSDISAGRVDVVVVYKVDRLSRSLADFARIIEAFDKEKVSFVSVTQAFNTTSSMGRLTLNVLLSFAQFEREITGERIRDKVAASKAKGMWMGGLPPLGYDVPTDQSRRALVVNEAEAKTVRLIFQSFLAAGNTSRLQQTLEAEGVRSKRWVTVAGRQAGGCRFSRGALRHLLSNRTYLGQVVHKGVAHPGRHPAILDEPTFDAAQKLLEAGRQKRREHVPRRASALLHGILFDAAGHRMELMTIARRRGPTYRYYVSPGGSADPDTIRRVPAAELEGLVLSRVAGLTQIVESDLDRSMVRDVVSRVEVQSSTVQLLLRRRANSEGAAVTLDVLNRRLRPGERLTQDSADPRLLRLVLPVRMKMRGGRTWAVTANGQPQSIAAAPDKLLIKRVREAHAIVRQCGAEPEAPLHRLRFARSPGRTADVEKVQWAFLAPDLQRRVLNGERPATAEWSAKKGRLPLLWSEQRALFDGHNSPPRAEEMTQ